MPIWYIPSHLSNSVRSQTAIALLIVRMPGLMSMVPLGYQKLHPYDNMHVQAPNVLVDEIVLDIA